MPTAIDRISERLTHFLEHLFPRWGTGNGNGHENGYENGHRQQPRETAQPLSFPRKFEEAFRQLIASHEYETLLEKFLVVYQYNRQFPWLTESEPDTKKGLVEALEHALVLYEIDRTEPEPYKLAEPAILIKQLREPLYLAVQELSANAGEMEGFERVLERTGIDPDSIQPDDLCREIAKALYSYNKRQFSAASRDPM